MIMENFSDTKKDQTIEKLEDKLNISENKIKEQEEIIKQDEEVKKDMGQKLYDVLLSLNDAQEEIERLKAMNRRLQKKKWLW